MGAPSSPSTPPSHKPSRGRLAPLLHCPPLVSHQGTANASLAPPGSAVTQHCASSFFVLVHATCWIPHVTNPPVDAAGAAAPLHFGFNSSHMALQTNDEQLIEKHPEKNQDYTADWI